MLNNKLPNALFIAAIVLMIGSLTAVRAQNDKKYLTDMGVAGLKLGDRDSGKLFLSEYQPRIGVDNLPRYYFYNGLGTTVMTVTTASREDPYFVTEIEVMAVGKSYRERHFYLKDTNYFATESGVFIGFRQSGGAKVAALLVGVPNISRGNMIGPNDIIRKKGEPTSRGTIDGRETFEYQVDSIKLVPDDGAEYAHTSQFEFKDRKLKKFRLMLIQK
jgi:hypothetical protein